MRIDDLFRDLNMKLDPALRGKVDLNVAENSTLVGVPNSIPDSELLFPDLLQAFSRLLNRRQSLQEFLPAEIKDRLSEVFNREPALRFDGLQPGVVTPVRENRQTTEAIRQLIQELEFAERLPALMSNEKKPEGQLEGPENKIAGTGVSQSTDFNKKIDVTTRREYQAVLETAIQKLENRSLAKNDGEISASSLLIRSAQHFVQQGKLPEVFSEWFRQTVDIIEDAFESSWLNNAEKQGKVQADPAILLLADRLNRPELIKVLGVLREWDAEMVQGRVPEAINPGKETQGLQKITDVVENLRRTLHESGFDLAELRQETQLSVPRYAQPLSGRLEYVLAQLFQPQIKIDEEAMRQFQEINRAITPKLAEGPVQALFAAKPEIFEALVKLSPDALKSALPKELQDDYLKLWATAKYFEVSPWLSFPPPERAGIINTLKELAATYEQPESFRLLRDSPDSRVFFMQIPVYGPGQERPYPAIIQIYEQKKESVRNRTLPDEVWVRVSIQTDNLGIVDLSFRLQEKKYLSIFSRFAEPTAAEAFRTLLAEIRQEFQKGPLELKKIAVSGRIPGSRKNE